MSSTDTQKREHLPADSGADSGEPGKGRSGWQGVLLSAVAILGEELVRRWLRGSRGGKGGGGRGRRS